MSYSLDIYNRKLSKPETNLGIFALFVSFFPQLVAGPIERASHLLPQFREKINFNADRIGQGLSLMLWGFLKKIVIADRLALVVNEFYNNPNDYHGLTFLLATIFFAFQIYCDFSGYSDIAIGLAKVMGFDLMKNFRTPYFSKSIGEFWKRWHISLSTWFRDYVYIPLGGNRTVKWRWYYNLFITFLISGLWHGANWTFIIWGGLHGCGLILESFYKIKTIENVVVKFLLVLKTFLFVCLGWIFFRANDLSDAIHIIQEMANVQNYSINQLSLYIVPTSKNTVFAIDIFLSVIFIPLLVILEYLFTRKVSFYNFRFRFKAIAYMLGIWLILVLGSFEKNEFIYFQF